MILKAKEAIKRKGFILSVIILLVVNHLGNRVTEPVKRWEICLLTILLVSLVLILTDLDLRIRGINNEVYY